MKTSISQHKIKKYLKKLCIFAFWILVWHIISTVIAQEVLLVSPVLVVLRLIKLCKEPNFWFSIANSFLHIFLGFALGFIFGIILAIMCVRFKFLWELFSPIIRIIKSTPVASFIILALVWFEPKYLSVFISFLMVMPIVFMNIFEGIKKTDAKLLQMANVFEVNIFKQIVYIYVPSVLPYAVSALSVGLGFAFKSGIAAEVIGIPNNTIGLALQQSKLYLNTVDIFAWTTVIIILSFLIEKILLFLINKLGTNFEKE